MTTFISIDSIFRNRTENPNPADFVIPIAETQGWASENRTIQSVRPHKGRIIPDLLHELTLLKLSIPYDATLLNEPYLYVEFSVTNTQATNLINTLGNTTNGVKLKNAIFQVWFDKIQPTNLYILYCCSMSQVIRFDPKASYRFRIFDRFGTTITVVDTSPPTPIDPLKQVSASIQIDRFEEK